MEAVTSFMDAALAALIPVLYFLGVFLKKSSEITDNYIPLILAGIGVMLALMYLAATDPALTVPMLVYKGIVNGILAAAGSVFANQVYKQLVEKSGE